MTWHAFCHLGLLAGLLVLGGCSQRSDSFLERVVSEGVSRISGGGKAAPPPPVPTRAQLAELPGPLLALTFADRPGTGFITAVNATSDGYITYQDRTRRSVIVRGGLVTGLQGFRYDLSAVKTQRNDPAVYQTPVSAWPNTLYRSYQFSLQSAADYQISVKCLITPTVREDIVIFERTHAVIRVQEDCTNDRRRFINTYWADAETGFIWKSQQWLGARLQPVTIEVVRPHPDSLVRG